MSWNFVSSHEILNQYDAEDFSFLSGETKDFVLKNIVRGFLIGTLNSNTCFCSKLYGKYNLDTATASFYSPDSMHVLAYW